MICKCPTKTIMINCIKFDFGNISSVSDIKYPIKPPPPPPHTHILSSNEIYYTQINSMIPICFDMYCSVQAKRTTGNSYFENC